MTTKRHTRSDQAFTWSGPDLAVYTKSTQWYIKLGLVSIGAAGAIFILTKDWISSAAIIVSAAFLAIFASRHPRAIRYAIDLDGVTIDGRRLQYDELRSFAPLPEGDWNGIVLKPATRLTTPRAIFYKPRDEDMIVAMLETHLAIDEYRLKSIDRLMQRIKF